MSDSNRRRRERNARVAQFGADNAANFISFDLPHDFRDQLNTKANAFDASSVPATTSIDERAVRILDGIVAINTTQCIGRFKKEQTDIWTKEAFQFQ